MRMEAYDMKSRMEYVRKASEDVVKCVSKGLNHFGVTDMNLFVSNETMNHMTDLLVELSMDKIQWYSMSLTSSNYSIAQDVDMLVLEIRHPKGRILLIVQGDYYMGTFTNEKFHYTLLSFFMSFLRVHLVELFADTLTF